MLEASAARLETLRGGTVPFYEPGLDEKLSEGLRAGRITVTEDAKAALSGREALLVCVGTPLSKVGDADLRQVEIADLCEAYGADVNDVVLGMGLDPRIGSTYLRPGIGFGGSCLPKELANLVRLGRDRNMPMHMLGSAGDANDERPSLIADRIATIVGDLDGQRIALLGLAFKPDTDDIRYSPAVALAVALNDRGATVTAHDPAVSLAQLEDVAGLDRAASAEDAIRGAAIVVLATEWQVYRDLDWAALRGEVGTPIVFDGRNALDEELLERAGWQVYRVGAAGSSRAAAGVTP
jgi:UDPglucose 6-dehydrogenase